MQCMKHIASEIMEYWTKWFRVKLDLGGVTSVRWCRNHQKYKRRMEQPREVGMTSPLWNFGVQRWELIRSAWSAGELSTGLFHLIVVSLLPYFVLFRFTMLHSLPFNNNRLCYFTDYYFTTKTWHNNITFPCDLCCVWQESFYCFSDCRCSHRHLKLRRTFLINWTVHTLL